jgi:hypothetical protein
LRFFGFLATASFQFIEVFENCLDISPAGQKKGTEPLRDSGSAQSCEKRTLVVEGEQIIRLIDHAAEH